MFDRIKAWHAEGLWTDAQVAKARDRGWVTAEQYADIMGET